jgi:O-antigen ligase
MPPDLLNLVRNVPGGFSFLCLATALFVLPMGTSPFTILAVLATVLALPDRSFYADLRGVLRQAWVHPVLAWIALVWIGLAYAPDATGVSLKYALKTHYWIYGLVAAAAVYSRFSGERLVQAFLAGLTVNAFIAFLQVPGWLPSKMVGKYFGLAGGYNTLSILLIIGILTASFYFRQAATPRRGLLMLGLMLVLFVNLFIIRGRAGYVTFAVLSPLLVYNLFRGRHLLVAFLLYLLLIGLTGLSPFVQERVEDTMVDIRLRMKMDRETAIGKKYSDLEERVYMWYWATRLFLENPVFGVGTGGLNAAMRREGAEVGVDHPHSNILHTAVSYGVVGVGIMLWFFLVLVRNGWYNRGSPEGFFVLAGALTVFVGGFLNTHLLDAGPAFLLAVLSGMQAGLGGHSQEGTVS